MYSGYELTENSRNKLLHLFPPTHPKLLGHHITEKFGVKPIEENIPKQPVDVNIIGYAINDKVEGFLVEIDGEINRPSGGLYHITWSINPDNGGKPVHTNELIKYAKQIEKIPIAVVAKVFSKATDAYLK